MFTQFPSKAVFVMSHNDFLVNVFIFLCPLGIVIFWSKMIVIP